MSNGVWCKRIPIALQWFFASTDSCKTLFSPAHNILNYFFSIFWMKVSWMSFLSLFILMWGRPSAPPCTCNSSAFSMWPNHPHWYYLLSRWGQMGHLLWWLSYLYWGSSVWVKPLDGKDMNLSNWRSFGRQRLRSLGLHFQESNDYFNYLFLTGWCI